MLSTAILNLGQFLSERRTTWIAIKMKFVSNNFVVVMMIDREGVMASYTIYDHLKCSVS